MPTTSDIASLKKLVDITPDDPWAKPMLHEHLRDLEKIAARNYRVKTIPLTPISRFDFTAAAQTTVCPRCHAMPGEYCRTPNKHIADQPHGERMKAYRESITADEYGERHSLKVKLPVPLKGDW